MIRSETFGNEGPGGPFEGVVSWDDALEGPRPGVLVAHTFAGQTAFEAEKAAALAAIGYVGFAIDLYGRGRRGTTREESSALMAELDGDRPLLAARINGALDALKAMPQVDPGRTGAIGFCFGGKCVLDLVRSGADMRGAVSFHGVYDDPPTSSDAPIAASVLVLHGWDDPLAPPEAVVALGNELTARGADWQIHAFGNTGHGFSNPKAAMKDQGIYYQPRTDARAWRAMRAFFEEVFGLDQPET